MTGDLKMRKSVFLWVRSMDTLSRRYHQLVRLNSDWAIFHVQLDLQNRTLTLSLEFVGTRVACPEREAACAMKNHAAERSWRHLDAMQFQTILTARIPRCSFNRCGCKAIRYHKRSAANLIQSGRWHGC